MKGNLKIEFNALESSDSSISSEELRDYMENTALNQPKKPKKNRSSLLVTNFQGLSEKKDERISSIHDLSIASGKRNSLKKKHQNLLVPESNFESFEIHNTLEIPSQKDEDFSIIKISKLSTMIGKATPGVISKQALEMSNKRMTIKSPMKLIARNQSSMSRRKAGSRLKESRLDSQASRIEERISRLNAPMSSQQKKQEQGIFFFESQNENKIIDVQINKDLKNRTFEVKAPVANQTKMNAYLKRKNYGSKWFLKPKKWNSIMLKSNYKKLRQIYRKIDESIATEFEEQKPRKLFANSVEMAVSRASIIEQHERMAQMKLKYNPYTKMIEDLKMAQKDKTSHGFMHKGSQQDLINEFEQDLHEAVKNKEESEDNDDY
jgi:hypothetical protein